MKRSLMVFATTVALAVGSGAWSQEVPNARAYDALSPGEQMIVDAIHESHVTAGGTMTKDGIAATKAETGWGNTYNQMYEDGLVTEPNLGLAVSKHVAGDGPAATGLGIATGAATGAGTSEAGVTTGAGAAAAGSGSQGTDGRAFGQGIAGSHTVGAGVTTGAGTSITTGNSGTVTTGAGAAAGVAGGAAAQTPAASVSRGAGGGGLGGRASGRGR